MLADRPVLLAPVGTSVRRWSELLAAEASAPHRLAELPAWQRLLTGTPALLPTTGTVTGTGRLVLTLPPEDTAALLGTAPGAFHTGVQEVLLAAFGIALEEWRRRQAPLDPCGRRRPRRRREPRPARRTSPTASTCPAPSAGSPPSSRSGWPPAR